MAPKRGTKRAAEATAELTVAKQLELSLKERAIARTMYDGLVEAINHRLAAGLTDDVRKMLIAMLPDGICVPQSDRQELQEATVRMLDGVFQSILSGMQVEIEEASTQLEAVKASKSTLEEKLQEAEVALKEATADASARKTELADATQTVRTAKATLAEKEKEQREGDAAHSKAKDDVAVLETAFNEDFRLLRDGEVEAEDAQQRYLKLEAIAATLGLEESLLTALPTCMVKKPAERGSFDAMVVAQFGEALTKRVNELHCTIENGVPAATQREAAVTEAAQALESAKQVQSVSADALTTAMELQKLKEQEHKAAVAALDAYEPEFQAAEKATADTQEQLQAFKDYNLNCFEVVRDRKELPSKKQKVKAAVDEDMKVVETLDPMQASFEAAEAGA